MTNAVLLRKAIDMEIKGKIIEVIPEKSGQSSNGEWRKKEYILETDSQYPKKICFMVWGEKIDQFNIKQGENLEVSVDLESREYNDRWYTDVKAWKVSRNSDSEIEMSQPRAQDYGNPQSGISPQLDDGDIPF